MAQNNRLKYYISFEADTKKAKMQINDMFQSLNSITAPKNIISDILGNTKDLSSARFEVEKFRTTLKNAVNVDTNRLNLNQLHKSLYQSGTSVEQLAKEFSKLGMVGVDAFNQITASVVNGETVFKRQNELFTKLADTMRNTIRWQISATAIRAFSTAINGAYRYAEDLNRSLNDIRIVTGQSVEQMDAFATKANKAARELSVSTKAYADAALIFYQQGLDDNEVLERTNAVMKMSNVTGEAAADVSSYMTAIWNNFDDGSKSLEYYGDVITRLGAETAASSEEIAGGMEKFAAVADTVGLSYEYASAALATIIDRTRQSEDVVGTSLRTIFARLSSLSLGETLEDGVDLTKYSKALDVVGVKILDQNDQLKSMDVILDELGEKWDDLGGAEKQALATTVAGVRQYSQLIALMDNYDLFKVNVDLAIDSEGTLTEQSKIFEESWLGAKKRVTAALEGIYDTLLDDKFLIGVTNAIGKFVELIDWAIDRAGGLPGALSVGALALRNLFGTELKKIFDDLFYNFRSHLGLNQQEIAEMVTKFADVNLELQTSADRNIAVAELYRDQAKILGIVLTTRQRINDAERESLELLFKRNGIIATEKSEIDNLISEKEKHSQKMTSSISDGQYRLDVENFIANKPGNTVTAYLNKNNKTYKDKVDFLTRYANDSNDIEVKKLLENINYTPKRGQVQADSQRKIDAFITSREKDISLNAYALYDKYKQKGKITSTNLTYKDVAQDMINQGQIPQLKDDSQKLGEELDKVSNSISKTAQNVQNLNKQQNENTKATNINTNSLQNNTNAHKQNTAAVQRTRQAVGGLLTNTFTGVMKFTSGVSAFSAAMKTLEDDTLSFGQKLLNFSSSISIAMLQFGGALSALKGVYGFFKSPEVLANLTAAFPMLQKVTAGATNLLGVLWKLKGAMAGLAIVIGLVVAGIKYVYDNSVEGKLKKAKKATEDLSKAASKAAAEYKKIQDTLKGLDDAYNNIEELKQGTVEWQKAVQDLNNSLSELVDKYGLVYGEDWYYKNGAMIITEKGEKKINDTETAKQERYDSAIAFSKIEENELEVQKAQTELQKDLEKLGTYAIGENEDGEMQYEHYGAYIKGVLEENPVSFDAFKKQIYSNDYFKDFSEDTLRKFWSQYENITLKQLEGNNATVGFSSQVDFKPYNLTDEIQSDTARQLEINYANEHKQAILDFDLKDEIRKSGLTEEEFLKQKGFGKQGSKYYELNADGSINTEAEKTKGEIENLVLREILPSFAEWITPEKINEAIQTATDEQYSKHYDLDAIEDQKAYEEAKKVSRDIATSKLDEKEITVYKEHLTELTDGLKQFGEDSSAASQMLDRITVANMRFNKGLEDIIDNWADYVNGLKEGNKESDEYAQLMDNLKSSVSELLDIEKESISDDFLLDNMNLFQEAAHGSIEALEQLRENAALAEIETLDSAIQNTEGVLRLKDWITSFNETWPDLEVGASLDTTNFDETIQKLLEVSGMTVEEMENILNDIGFEPVIEYDEVSYEDAQKYGGSVYKDVNGKKELVSNWEEETNLQGSFFIPKINASKTTYRGSPKTTINATNRSKAAGNASSRRKDTKKADDEIERYHLIKETIEDLNRELDRLGKEKDRAWGNAHLQYIDREIAKTEEAIDAQKEYLRQIEENYGKDRGALAAYGGQFDENGRLTNYEELMREQIAKYNAAVRSGSETQQEAAEEQYNNFKKALEQYEETADLFESEYEQLLDLQNQFYDKLLERIQYKVEVDVQISEEADKYYDYILDMLEDKAYSAAEAIAYLGKKTEESLKRIASYQEALNSMFEMHGFGDDAYERFANGELSIEELATAGFTSQEIDMLIEYRGALMEENKQLMEMRDQVMSSLTDTFDEYMDTLDKMIDKFDHLNAVTSAYKNIVDIVGKKALGISNDMLKAMDEATVATAENTVKASKDRLDAAEAAMADMEKLEADYQEAMANANKATSEDEKLYWLGEAQGISDAMEHIEEESRAAKEAFLGSWEEALTTAREVFESNVQLAMEKFEDAVSGIYGSLDAMKEAYDQNKVLREQYLEEYERIYELNKLNRDITNSIDDIDSIAAKQALRDLQEEINELQRSGAQISKYDLDMLRMRYELRLAEIALEDAQNAKSQVRMSRDNDGNWSYVYTADEGAVADAQQGYEDKMMAMQQSSNDYLNQMSEQWIAAEIEMEQAYQKIWEDRTLSDEERAAAIDRLYEYYGERFNFFNDQITNALGNNKILYEEDWLAWADKNNIQIESNDSFLTNFEDTVLGVTTGFDDVDTLHQELLDAVGRPGEGGYLGDLDEAYTDWQENVSDIMNAAGTSVTDFGDDFAEVAEDTVEDSAEMAEEVENMSETMKDAFEDVVGAVKDWRKEYSDVIAANIRQNSNMINSLASLLDRINKTIDAQIKLNSVTGEGPTSATGSYVGNTIDDDGTGGPGDGGKAWHYNGRTYSSRQQAERAVTNYIRDVLYPKSGKNWDEYNSSGQLERDSQTEKAKIQYYNTGGYTGAWGSSGRLAVLHEKELVLNKDDTANFLSAINIVRDIVKVVDMNAAISGMGIGALAASGIAGAGSTIEQSVTIYADFPNATDHSEIELALANLVNSASQYANRKG